MQDDPVARMIYRKLGEAIVAARGRAGLTQQGLAMRSEGSLSRSSVANIERGRQRVAVHQIYLLAGLLGVEAIELLPRSASLKADRGPTADQAPPGFHSYLADLVKRRKDTPNDEED